MRFAYLCNVYPAVSHSFVRREIEAMERCGHHVSRFSIRPVHDGITDAADLREARVTSVVLEQGWFRLICCALLLLTSDPRRAWMAFVKAHKLSGKGLKENARHLVYLVEGAWLASRCKQLRIEHLHAHFGTNPAAVAAIAHAWGGPPFSFTIHGPDEFDAPVQQNLREKAANAGFVAVISSYCRSQLMRWMPEQQWSKIRLVRCGLDAKFLALQPRRPPTRSVEFLSVARLSQQKGLPLLIDACAQLRKAGERFHLTIVGYGEMGGALSAKIQHLGLQEHITLAGIKSSDQVIELLANARAFVLPSFAEGLPVVLMEALACGRAVIATAIAGIPELVDDECGWLIPAGSVTELVSAMTSALRLDTERLFEKGMNGRNRVLQFHDMDQNAQSLLDAITTSLIESRTGYSTEAIN